MAEPVLPAERGTYVLLFRVPAALAVRVGALGRLELLRGWLLYVGSARGPGGLAARVGRHFGATGRSRWHVDYLVRALPPAEAWVGPAREKREAEWVMAVAGMAGVVPAAAGFGASDARAGTHLFHSPGRPALATFRSAIAERLPGDPVPRRIRRPGRPEPESLESLMNLGPASAAWLREAGIYGREDLARLGPVEAFIRVRQNGRRPSLNLLYAIAGALEGCRWDRLPEGTRGALLMELDARDAEALEGPWARS